MPQVSFDGQNGTDGRIEFAVVMGTLITLPPTWKQPENRKTNAAKRGASLTIFCLQIGVDHHATVCLQIPENFRKFSDAGHSSA
jgi:hypothetical protein